MVRKPTLNYFNNFNPMKLDRASLWDTILAMLVDDSVHLKEKCTFCCWVQSILLIDWVLYYLSQLSISIFILLLNFLVLFTIKRIC